MKTPLIKNALGALASRIREATPTQRVDVAGTIRSALVSAGLDTAGGPASGVADTVRRALSGAGIDLHPGDARASPDPVQAHRRTALPGTLSAHHFKGPAGARDYKLYVPSTYDAAGSTPMPLVVMLHGCTQSPDDFAAGTRMNELAERHGVLVAYPAQAANANGSKCWNWFRSEDQQRDQGEPSLIVGIVRDIAAHHRVDARRVYVAGLSAGAAMAVILGAAYPDVFAAVGAHSGLPYAAAHDMPSAFGAMNGQRTGARRPAPPAVPTIVFHGDQDHTVAASNGVAIVDHAVRTAPRAGAVQSSTQSGTTADGSRFQRSVHSDAAGTPLVEHWVLHGAGHAWSGGSAAGSYTSTRGPDASAEMLRFFLLHALPSTDG